MAQTSQVRGRATTIRQDNGDTVVTYHATDVVRFNANRIILNTGGWRTVTTKTRMNQAAHQFGLGYSVCQRDYDWYVRTSAGEFDMGHATTINRKTGKVTAD